MSVSESMDKLVASIARFADGSQFGSLESAVNSFERIMLAAHKFEERTATDHQQLKPEMPRLEKVLSYVESTIMDKTKLSFREKSAIGVAYEYLAQHFGH